MDIQDLVVITDRTTGGKKFYAHKDIKEKLSDDKTILRLFRRLDGGVKVTKVTRKLIQPLETRLNRNSKYFFSSIKVGAILQSDIGEVSFTCSIIDFADYIKKL